MQKENSIINLNLSAPAVAVDGHQLFIDKNSGSTDLMFIQVLPQLQQLPDNQVSGSVVAHLRMSFDQLKNY